MIYDSKKAFGSLLSKKSCGLKKGRCCLVKHKVN